MWPWWRSQIVSSAASFRLGAQGGGSASAPPDRRTQTHLRNVLPRCEQADPSPLARLPHALPQPLAGQVGRSGRWRRLLLLILDERRRPDGVPPETEWILDAVKSQYLPVSLEDPVPTSEVVVEALAEPPSAGQPKRPHRVEVHDGAVDVTAAHADIRLVHRRGVEHQDSIANQ